MSILIQGEDMQHSFQFMYGFLIYKKSKKKYLLQKSKSFLTKLRTMLKKR